MVQKVIILGAGGFGREVLDVILADNQASPQPRWEMLGFIDDDPEKKGQRLNGAPVLGGLDALAGIDRTHIRAVCAIGDPASRKKMVAKAANEGIMFCNIFHPAAVYTPFITWGTGIIVTAGAILTNTITVGNHVHINLGTTIGHDVEIGAFCTLAPGAHISGQVRLETGCYIGTGAVILQDLEIGHWSIIGAGAVVTQSLPPNVTAVGVPAKVIKERPEGWEQV